MEATAELSKDDISFFFKDNGTPWYIGQTCLTAIAKYRDGTEAPVATIEFSYDTNARKAVYKAKDLSGKELYPATYSLPLLKKQIMEHKQELIASAEAQREEHSLDPVQLRMLRKHDINPASNQPAVPSPYANEFEEKRGKRGKGLKNIRGKNHPKRSRGR